jgi:hypothetical protein
MLEIAPKPPKFRCWELDNPGTVEELEASTAEEAAIMAAEVFASDHAPLDHEVCVVVEDDGSKSYFQCYVEWEPHIDCDPVDPKDLGIEPEAEKESSS